MATGGPRGDHVLVRRSLTYPVRHSAPAEGPTGTRGD